MNYANLHFHSTYSDALFTPEMLVYIAKAMGYRAVALTDHETDGGCKELRQVAAAEGIESLNGVEFYGMEDGKNLHLVALDFDENEPQLRSFIRRRVEMQANTLRLQLERAASLGYLEGVTFDDVAALHGEGAWLCIDSVMHVMKAKRLPPVNDSWAEFRSLIFSAPEARALRGEFPSAEEVIRLVRGAGGIVGFAHPGAYLGYTEKLVSYGLNGIEVSHPTRGEWEEQTREVAKTFGLYPLGGTDHTGAMSGCGGKEAVPAYNGLTEEEFDLVRHRRLG